jgi:hypothetical protein
VDHGVVTVHREPRAGFRGLVAEVRLADRTIGLVHLSGTTARGENIELWTADAIDGATCSSLSKRQASAGFSEDRRKGGAFDAPSAIAD